MANFLNIGEIKISIGDTIAIHYRLIEKEKVSGKTKKEVKEEVRERIQIFEGIVIAIRGSAENKSFTVRRIGTGAIGIERIFPAESPWIKKVEVKSHAKVRRAKLYYLRDKVGKEAEKLKEKVLQKKQKITKATKKIEKKEIISKPAVEEQKAPAKNEPKK